MDASEYAYWVASSLSLSLSLASGSSADTRFESGLFASGRMNFWQLPFCTSGDLGYSVMTLRFRGSD